jgi:hypothetical protein
LLPIEGADAERLRQMHLHGGLCGQMLHQYDVGPLSTALEDFGRRDSSTAGLLAATCVPSEKVPGQELQNEPCDLAYVVVRPRAT